MRRCKLKPRNFLLVFLLAAVLSGGAIPARADIASDLKQEPKNASVSGGEAPAEMEELQEQEKAEPIVGVRKSDKKDDKLSNSVKEEKDLAIKIRRDSQHDAAMSFGARGGLAWRTKQIMERLDKAKGALDKTYDFRRLLIKAPSNMFIEPPIISEALNNFIVTNDGNEAAVADRIYAISRQARIVSAPRNWRQYLEREWAKILPPPDILLPETPQEREAWRLWVKEGWEQGIAQADEIFQSDLNRLEADFEGMVRYNVLLAENKVSAPYATMEDRGVSGNDIQAMVAGHPMTITNEMRVGDRAIKITAPATLRKVDEGDSWQPPVEAPQ